jgi:hypothetical protein
MPPSRLGTGVFRPDRRSRPWPRARRAAAVPVAGPDASAAGASWRGAPKPHLQQVSGRSLAQLYTPRAPMPVRPARSPGNQCAPRGDTAALSFLHKELGAKAGTPTSLHKRTRLDGWTHTPSSHGDGGAQEHRRLRSSLRRGTAILRRDGQQPGKNRRRRVSTSRSVTGKRPMGRREKGAAVLTMGRWWSRGRLGGEACEGEVGVHAGGCRLGSCSLSPAGPRLLPRPARRGGDAPWR